MNGISFGPRPNSEASVLFLLLDGHEGLDDWTFSRTAFAEDSSSKSRKYKFISTAITTSPDPHLLAKKHTFRGLVRENILPCISLTAFDSGRSCQVCIGRRPSVMRKLHKGPFFSQRGICRAKYSLGSHDIFPFVSTICLARNKGGEYRLFGILCDSLAPISSPIKPELGRLLDHSSSLISIVCLIFLISAAAATLLAPWHLPSSTRSLCSVNSDKNMHSCTIFSWRTMFFEWWRPQGFASKWVDRPSVVDLISIFFDFHAYFIFAIHIRRGRLIIDGGPSRRLLRPSFALVYSD